MMKVDIDIKLNETGNATKYEVPHTKNRETYDRVRSKLEAMIQNDKRNS